MQALVFDGTHIRLKDIPKPQPPENEALVRVLYSGVCNTDLEIVQGYMDFKGVPGHEFVGIVEACSDENWIGKRVVGEINCGCGECDYCYKGLSRHCPRRTVLGILGRDGAHAQFLSLPIENLHVLPSEIDDKHAVFVEPLAAAVEIVEQVHLQPGKGVTIIGDGKLGQLISRVMRLQPVDLTVVGKHNSKLEILHGLGIATQDARNVNLRPQDVVIECSGVFEGLQMANSLLAPRGNLVLKSTYHGEVSFNPAKWVIYEITVVGSRCGLFEPAIHLLANGLVDPEPLISSVISSKDAPISFDVAQQDEIMKVLIDWR